MQVGLGLGIGIAGMLTDDAEPMGGAQRQVPDDFGGDRSTDAGRTRRQPVAEAGERGVDMLTRPLGLAPAKINLRQAALDGCMLCPAPHHFLRAPKRVQGLHVMQQGLVVAGHAGCLLGCQQQEMQRFVPHLGPGVVQGEHARELLRAVSAEQQLDAGGNLAVQGAAPGEQQAFVDRLLDQRVLEYVGQLGCRGVIGDQVRRLQPAEAFIQSVAVIDDRPQDAVEKAAANHGGDAQNAFEALIEPIDPGHDDALDRIGNSHVLMRRRRPLAALVADDGFRVDQGPDHLLQVKRVAACLIQDHVARPVDPVGIALQQQSDQALAFGHGQRLQGDFEKSVVRQRRGPEFMEPPDSYFVRAPKGDDKQAATRGDRQKVLNERRRRAVEPMHVVDDQDDRRVLREALEQPITRTQHMARQRLTIEIAHPFRRRVRHLDAEERCRIGQHLVALGRKQPADGPSERRPSVVIPRPFDQPEKRPQHLDERPVAQALPKRPRVPLEIRDRMRKQRPDLLEQARLANASLTGDQQQPARPGVRQAREYTADGVDLTLPPDQRPPPGTTFAEWPAAGVECGKVRLAPWPKHLVQRLRPREALQRRSAERAALEFMTHELMGAFADDDSAWNGRSLHAAGKMDDRAAHAVGYHAAGRILRFGSQHAAGTQADADLQLVLARPTQSDIMGLNRLLQGKRRVASPFCMVLLNERDAEDRHDPVAAPLCDGAAVTVHRVPHQRDRRRQDIHGGLRVGTLDQRGRTHDVGKKDRDDPAVARLRITAGRLVGAGLLPLGGKFRLVHELAIHAGEESFVTAVAGQMRELASAR